MPNPLPERPSLVQLKIQAKELLRQLRLGDPAAKLAAAQTLVAGEYGFPNWRMLRAHVDELTNERLAQLAATFRRFASEECRGRSACYECWAEHIADDPQLLEIAAFGRPPIPNLMLACVHLLVMANPACALARHYASVDRNPLAPEPGWPRFRQFCLEHRHEIVRLMRARTTQTNEVRRSAYLAAAFNVVWNTGGKKPLALVEIGTSAGLGLCFDQYGFRIAGKVLGNTKSPLILDVETRGELIPPIPRSPLPVRQRIGIDLRPITPFDSEGVLWLNALIWPEHHDRRGELKSALQIASEIDRQLIAGDAVAILDEVLRGISPDCTLCVFQTHSFNQIPPKGREKLTATMKALGEQHPVYFVSRHNRLTLDRFDGSAQSPQTILADTDPHGRWIHWLAGNGPANIFTPG